MFFEMNSNNLRLVSGSLMAALAASVNISALHEFDQQMEVEPVEADQQWCLHTQNINKQPVKDFYKLLQSEEQHLAILEELDKVGSDDSLDQYEKEEKLQELNDSLEYTDYDFYHSLDGLYWAQRGEDDSWTATNVGAFSAWHRSEVAYK